MTKTHAWSELRAKVLSDPAQRVRIEEGKQAMLDGIALGKLRAELGLEEYEVAKADDDDSEGASQGTDEDLYVRILRDHVEAIGGRLEITAVFPDGTHTLTRERRWTAPQSEEPSHAASAPNGAGAARTDREPAPVSAASPSSHGEKPA